MEEPAQDLEQKVILKKFDDFDDYETFIVRSLSKGVKTSSFRDTIYKGLMKPQDNDGKLTIFSGLTVRPSRN